MPLGNPEQPIHAVPPTALTATVSSRVALLANHRPFKSTEDFSRHFTVRQAALDACASERVTELAAPRKVNIIMVTPREYAFSVNPTALKYTPTGRLLELAKPLVRD